VAAGLCIRALRDALNEWLSLQGRHALPPPAATAPPPRKRGTDPLDGPFGAALALVVTLAASLGGGVVAALFGCVFLARLVAHAAQWSQAREKLTHALPCLRSTAPVTSLVVVLLILLGLDSDGGGVRRAESLRTALFARRRL